MDLGKDFVLLEGQFSNYRIRLFAWSKTCGFLDENGYDRRLDHPAWMQHVQLQLNSICLLFMDAHKIIKKYDIQERRPDYGQAVTGPNAQFIAEAMCDFLSRISKTKSKNGIFGAVTWAVVHKKRFKDLLDNLGEYIEGLEFVTKNLDLFETQRHIVEAEINTISDTNALKSMIIVQPSEIEEVDTVSDAASSRLRLLRERSSSNQVDNETFFTALSHPEVNLSPIELEDIEDENSVWDVVPQQERIMHEVFKQAGTAASSQTSTALDESNWGNKILKLIQYDQLQTEDLLSLQAQNSQSPRFLRVYREVLNTGGHVHSKRVGAGLEYKFSPSKFEHKSARLIGTLPFRDLKARATIEGPPQSPYKGGIFHLIVHWPNEYPYRPFEIRFLTKVYHPNIDHQGVICMDLLGQWSPSLSLPSILECINSMLSDPQCDDPLVPEIAMTYVQDRELYNRNARAYTEKYATDEQSYPDCEIRPFWEL
jgi:ubiquitin-conjugating enzyme E2 D/E